MTAFLWVMFWQTLLVALAAAAFGGVLRGERAAARHWLFLGALLFAALLPAASVWLRVSIPRAAGAGTGTVAVATPAAARPAAGPTGNPAGAPPYRLDFGVVLGGLWGAAVMLQAAGLARRTWRARQAWRRAAPERVVEGVPVLRGAEGPFTLGWLRPRIVLPAALLKSEAWTSAALAHELAHVRRRDYLWAWLSELALLPLAWHPAARWLAGKAALEREGACDEAALAANPAYPTHLVDIAAALHLAAAPRAGLWLAHRRGLEQRIAWLTAPAHRRSRARMAVAGAGLGAAVAAAWALGGGVRRVPMAGHAMSAATAAARPQARQPAPVSQKLAAAECIQCAPPAYPAAARAAGVQGTVEMHIRITADGSVAGVGCGVGDPVLLAAAEDAVRGWRYHPLRLDGQPVSISSTVTTTFSLDGGAALPAVRGLRGVVCDEQGGRLAGAAIIATGPGTRAAAQTTSAADGTFALDLPDGLYDVQIQRRGFRQQSQRVTLPLQHEWLVVLALGQANQFVEVTGGSQQRF